MSISLVPITWIPPKAASHLLIFLLYPSHRDGFGSAAAMTAADNHYLSLIEAPCQEMLGPPCWRCHHSSACTPGVTEGYANQHSTLVHCSSTQTTTTSEAMVAVQQDITFGSPWVGG